MSTSTLTLHEAFSPPEAWRILKWLGTIHYMLERGSWLNMAEMELNVS